SYPKQDVFAGYQWQHPGATVPATNGDPNNPTPFVMPDMPEGAGAAYTYNFDPHWGFEGDLGYSRQRRDGSCAWTHGVWASSIWRTDGANFFVNALGSFHRVTYGEGAANHNGVGAILGGGMDFPFTKSLAWRVFQVDYAWAHHNFPACAAAQ